MFDSHAHVAFEQFDDDREAVVKRAREGGLAGWIEVGTDVERSRRAVGLAKKVERVYASVGIHPNEVDKLGKNDWLELEGLMDDDAAVAVGEIGLDYYRGGIKTKQLKAVKKIVKLAQDRQLPVIWHIRNGEIQDAHDDLIRFLGGLSSKQRPPGVAHTFSGTLAQAQQYIKLGLYIGISGVVTFKNAGVLIEVVRQVPLDKLLIETDCPYLAPEPHRGGRNEPAYVVLIAQKIAVIKGISTEEVEKQTDRNARRLFCLQ